MANSGTDSSGQNMGVKVGSPLIYNLPTPASYAAGAQAYTAADIVGGVIVHDGTGSGTGTLPTAAAVAAILRGGATPLNIGDAIDCLIINGANASGTITLAAGAGMTFDANQGGGSRAIPFATSKYISFRFTGVTPGAETLVLYS